MKIFTAGLAAILLAGCATTNAPIEPDQRSGTERFADFPEWMPSGEAGRVHTSAGLLMLDYRNSASVQRRILGRAFEVEEEREVAAPALERLGHMGYSLSEGARMQLRTALGDDVVNAYEADIAGYVSPIKRSSVELIIPAAFPLSEAITLDQATGRYFALSIADSKLVATTDGNEWKEVALAGSGRPMGLAIDEQRRTLWVTLGRLGEETDAFVGLVAVDLDSLAETSRIAVNASSLNDLTVAADGSVYASDSLGGGIYSFNAGTAKRIDEPGTFRSPQGIAIHPQGDFAYVSDYSYGLAILNLETGQAVQLLAPSYYMLDGIDGLYMRGRSYLIAIQNGTNPMRILRLDLSSDGGKVTGLTPLERAHPEWGEPTVGQMLDDRLIYISNPQWHRFGEGGMLEGDEPLSPNPVRAISFTGHRAGQAK